MTQLVEKMEGDKRQREEMEQVRLELRLEQEEEANRQREIVSDHGGSRSPSLPGEGLMWNLHPTGSHGEEDQTEDDDGAGLPGGPGL